jgi:hypothetical protein
MKSLGQMIDQAHAHARRKLIGKSDAQIVPFVHVQFRDRADAIMPAPFSNERQKAVFIAALRLTLKMCRASVVNYFLVSEAWVAKQDHEPRDGDLLPSERETRWECVIVSAGDHRTARMKVWEILRDDKGRVTDLVEDKAAAKSKFGGRMFNLLSDEDEA